MASAGWRTSGSLILAVLAFAVLTNAQAPGLGGLQGLPTLTTDNALLGATTTSSASSATSSGKTSSSGSHTTAATKSGATLASSSGGSFPGLTTTTTTSAVAGALTDAPTLYGVGVPPLVVPDTSGAPFMQKSTLPEGFVFICVGAILAFLGLSVVAWRGLVAWSLHRSVRRAAAERYVPEKKSSYGAPTNFSSVYQSANVSLEHLTAKDTSYHGGAGPQKASRPSNPSSQRQSRQPAGGSLFFSPTAGSGQRSNRASTYLPSGYYASGASALAGGAGIATFGGPPAAGYGRVGETFGDSPPATPGLGPTTRHDRSLSRDRHPTLDVPTREHQRSRSNLRTSTEPGQRAPSAMLDELFSHSTGMR